MKDLVRLARFLVWASVAAAIYQELRKPPEARTWQGKVAGVVPYDFRVPTPERLRDAYWNPESDIVFSENVWGVGWAVNVPVLARRLVQTARQYVESSREAAERLRPDERLRETEGV